MFSEFECDILFLSSQDIISALRVFDVGIFSSWTEWTLALSITIVEFGGIFGISFSSNHFLKTNEVMSL